MNVLCRPVSQLSLLRPAVQHSPVDSAIRWWTSLCADSTQSQDFFLRRLPGYGANPTVSPAISTHRVK